MAIHVRPRRSQFATILRRHRQRCIIALCSTTTVLLILALSLFYVRFLILQEGDAHFTAYVPSEDSLPLDSKAPTHKELSAGGASPNSSVTPSILVATGPSSVVMDTMDFSIDSSAFGTDALGGMGICGGLGTGGFGTGTGKGSGDGIGDGDGGGSGGKKGLNDDIQVVLVLDASGSMDRLFTMVSDALHEFLITLNQCTLNDKKARVNVGIVCYGQARDNGSPQLLSGFSKDVGTLRGKLKEVACDGSYENCGEAIAFAVEKFPWNLRERDDMLKVIFIAGNEEFTQGSVDYRAALRRARQRNIIVNTIHCGGPNEEWFAAAREGRGEGFHISLEDDANSDGRGSEEDQQAAATALTELEIIPCGSPHERALHRSEIPKLTHKPNKRKMSEWVQETGRPLVRGFDWDAAEICRREGRHFNLAMVGGLPNLPPELRSKGERGAFEHIRAAAAARQEAIDKYKRAMFGNNEFCSKALDVIRRQAADKGIDMQI